ncbi:hypothetical protein H9639_03215 [Arthrobacter sp. Sa2CUA1]|uniref:Uncharacterized protein n=1 Tax=Arthrobacter gallicola TaxID=2762225 RepID=A0ABR8UQC6_9MICC|nr:hypothetical protein [Arthrobacter gallicola]MBD7994306.1 hypothetical protein [Arthrobacter gallicola]
MDFTSTTALLAGPRGRGLCLELAKLAAPRRPGESYGSTLLPAPGLSRESEQVLRTLAGIPERPQFSSADLHRSLVRIVRQAAYWQPPDETAQLLTEAEPCRALLPLAAAVVRSPAAAWWSEPAAPVTHCVQWIQTSTVPGTSPPALQGAGPALARWRAGITTQEANTPFSTGWTGRWWSSPTLSGVVSSTPAVPGNGPAGLQLVEDALDWTLARSYPVRAAPGTRIYEIHGPGDWQELAARYPLDVTRSRGSTWSLAAPHSGDGTWVMPDFSAVADHYDAVHLTVTGYLSTAGVVLAAGDAKTMLAGWAPGETWWLNDVLVPAGEPTNWQRASAPHTEPWPGSAADDPFGAGLDGVCWQVQAR